MTGLPHENRLIYVAANPYEKPGDNLDLKFLLVSLWNSKILILTTVLLSTMVAFILTTYVISPVYRAKATIQPTKESAQIINSYLGSTLLKKQLIEKYNLLPILSKDLWNNHNSTWKVEADKQPTIQLALSQDSFPLRYDNSFNIFWEGHDPAFCVAMIEKVIYELEHLLNKEYLSDAQIQIDILQNELLPTIESYKSIVNKMWDLEKISIVQLELLTDYTRVKAKISELKIQDVLSKRFYVVSQPVASATPVWPNKNRVIVLTFFGTLIAITLTILFYRTIKASPGQSL